MTSAQRKPFESQISKGMVWRAYQKVKANGGAGGVDDKSIADFDEDIENNLYKIWNRMVSGSYFPPAVKAVPIPKKTGGERILGIPTVGDRIAQMVVKEFLEPRIDRKFHPDSYGYRPFKSALDAVGTVRRRCWEYEWALEFDIKGLFDNISHSLLMKAVKVHAKEKWVLLYIERWLKAPMKREGKLLPRAKGTPQGGVISPILANLFLHYAFDLWMTKNYPQMPIVRYADDGLVQCHTKGEAEEIREALDRRFKDVGLEIHPDKTKIVHCFQAGRKRRKNEDVKFDFLGYTFKPRLTVDRKGRKLTGFLPAVSDKAKKAINKKVRDWEIRKRSDKTLDEIAEFCNPMIRGWMNYYGRFYKSALYRNFLYLNSAINSWAKRTLKSTGGSYRKSCEWVVDFHRENPKLFAHWEWVPPFK